VLLAEVGQGRSRDINNASTTNALNDFHAAFAVYHFSDHGRL